MAMNVTEKLISSHLVDGEMEPGTEIGLKIDQTLTQDATGTWSCSSSKPWGSIGLKPSFRHNTSTTT